MVLSMSKKVINLLLSILLSIPLIAGAFASSDLANALLSPLEPCSKNHYTEVSLEKPCDMDHCNPLTPKCPLCPSANSINPYLSQEGGAYLPPPASSIVLITPETLSDQGVIRSVFRPPTSPV
jgi:hypothetical protein